MGVAAYGATPVITDGFPSSTLSANWTVNGTVNGNGPGLVSNSSNGGSAIFAGTVPAPTADYESTITMKTTATGGSFVIYARASSNALLGPTLQGSFYAIEFTPTVVGSGCTMAVNYYKYASSVLTTLGTQTLACSALAAGMKIRTVMRANWIWLMTDKWEAGFVVDGTLTSGRPGFGARSTPAGNGLILGEVYPSDTVAPGTIAAANVRTAVFYNRVDLEWPGVVDDANGSGMAMYQIYRDVNNANNYQYMGNFRYSNWSDTTVTAGTTYSYRLHPLDMHLNATATVVTVVTPANGIGDPRRTGVRPLGTYWGASPENIDLQSGNLSFSLPTVTAQGRGGSAVPFRLSYNSQNWRKDLGGAWKLGMDVGYGWGWRMLAGSLTPIYSDWWTVHHYVYTDGTGAEYRLETNAGGVWSSKDGIFVEYDANTGRLYSPGGSYWEFGCRASGTEQDTGTLYPTRIVDTNGNETKIRYQLGLHHSAPESCSGRLKAVEDVRAVSVSGEYKTYSFSYNNDAIPHLTGIQSHVPGDASNFTFSYTAATSLVEPFTNTATGQTAVDLQTMTVPGGAGLQFSMTYNGGPHELQRVTMPHGGTLDWVYGSKTLLGSRTMREVVSRVTNANDGTGNKTYTLYHDDGADANKLAHEYTVVVDATGTADKAYFFHVANDFKLGLFNALNERTLPSYGTMRVTQATWATTANGNPYISRTDETVGTTVARVEQTLNDHGNLTERKQYGYFATGGTAPLVRTFTYTYLATSPYTSRHIWNRPLAVTVVKPGGSPVTLSSNTYDIYPFNT
ncbi:MAG: hypothetical protein JNM66_30030, partial [Bryobacterales bacterium]|nr:hypothetical protein [Bryobacterales bacterium]